MYKIISESELKKALDNYEEVRNDPTQFLEILYKVGIDTSKPIEIQENLPHRNAFKEIVTCPRFVGVERTDVEWQDSGNISMASLIACSDPETQKDIAKMSRTITSLNPYEKERQEFVHTTITTILGSPDTNDNETTED